MSEMLQRWEGRTVKGRFPLQSYLGGSDHSAVYLTLRQGGAGDSEKAAIKLIPADAVDAEKQLLRWQAACELSHPNLISIFEAGRCELDGRALLYVVEEYAEENLAQILPERALTAEETRGMLPPVLRALQYVHGQGFAHGHIHPSNILAIGDQVKLSSDALVVPGDKNEGAKTSAYDPPEAATGAGSTATDVWQLGMTVVEALTQRLPKWDRARPSAEMPASVREPFREIAAHCLQIDAAKRWTVREISDWLEGKRPSSPSARSETAVAAPSTAQRKQSVKWPYGLGLAAVVAIAVFLIARPKPSNPPAEYQSPQTQQSAGSENAKSAPTSTPTELKPSPAATGEAKVGAETAPANADAGANDHQHGVVQRVMPQVSPSARGTIQGKVRVRVKVEVDAAGNVAKAELESAGPSKYFSRLALEAARGWKFSLARAGEQPGAREWKLQFAFSRARTEVSAVRTKR